MKSDTNGGNQMEMYYDTDDNDVMEENDEFYEGGGNPDDMDDAGDTGASYTTYIYLYDGNICELTAPCHSL